MKRTRLVQKLEREPQRFNFFQAVRLLERARGLFDGSDRGAALVGEDNPPPQEAVRFRVQPGLSFPSAEIEAFQQPEEGKPPAMSITFLGLLGHAGVLPRHYTQLAIERARQKDFSLRDFCDVFHHRLVSLFYRGWRKFRFYVGYERAAEVGRAGDDDFTQALYSLVGLGTGALRHRQKANDEIWLYYAGQFSHAPRNAVSLAAMVSDFLGIPTKVNQFIGQWLYLGPTDQSKLPTSRFQLSGNNVLGTNVVVGERVWGVEQRVRLEIGPMTYRQFLEFMPCSERLLVAAQFIRGYIGPEFDFDVQPVLLKEEVPSCRLGGDGEPSRLGWNSWLRTEPFVQDARDAIFTNEGWTVL